MINYQVLANSVDVSVTLRIIDSTDGTPETGVVFNTSGIDLQYRRSLSASVAITEATLAALTTAHADGGFLHIGNGYYRLDLPDAAVAAGASSVLIHGTVTGMVVIGAHVNLTPVPADVRQWLGTAAATPATAGVVDVNVKNINNVAAATPGASGGLATVDASLNVDANVVHKGTAQAGAAATITLAAGASATNSLYNGSVLSILTGTGAGQARVITAYVGATKVATMARNWATNPDSSSVYKIHGLAVPRVDDNLAVILQTGTGTGQIDFTAGVAKANVAQWLGTAAATPTVAGVPEVDLTHVAGSTTSVSVLATNVADMKVVIDDSSTLAELAEAVADAVWDEAIAGHLTAGSTGEALSDAGGAGTPPTVGEIADAVWDEAQAGHVAAGSFGEVATETAAILVDTGTTLDGRIPAALVSGRMDASVGAMAANVMTAAAAAADLTTELQTGLATAAALTTVDDFLDTEIAAIKAKTDALPTDPADQSLIIAATDAVMARLGAPAGASMSADIAARASQASLDTLDNFVDTEVAAILAAVDTEVGAIKVKTDQLTFTTANQVDSGVIDKTGFRLSAAGVDDVFDEVVEGTTTLRQAMRLANTANGGKLNGAGTATENVRDLGDTKNRIVAAVDAAGNRTAVTLDLT